MKFEAFKQRRVLILPSPPGLPEYRIAFFEELARFCSLELLIAPESLTKLRTAAIDEGISLNRLGASRVFAGKISIVSAIVAVLSRPCDVVVLYGNINEPVVHVLLVYLRLRRVPVVLWTQYHRAFSSLVRDKLKMFWANFAADGIWLYTDRELEEWFAGRRRDRRIIALNNGLAGRGRNIVSAGERWRCGYFVFCARLEPKNRIDIVIGAYRRYRDFGGRRELHIVGDGADRDVVRALLVRDGGLEGVIWWGGLGKVEADEVVGRAFMMVHPVAIGLSVITAFEMGIPLIAHGESRFHMPEFWLFEDNVTGGAFYGNFEPSGVSLIGECSKCMLRMDPVDFETYSRWSRACLERVKQVGVEVMASRAKRHLVRLIGGGTPTVL